MGEEFIDLVWTISDKKCKALWDNDLDVIIFFSVCCLQLNVFFHDDEVEISQSGGICAFDT